MPVQAGVLPIERREYKYLIDAPTKRAVRRALAPFCRLDRHAAEESQGRYTIESLYFDSRGLRLFRANRASLVDRIKLRVRHYPGAANGLAFLEVKRRINDVSSKTRAALPMSIWAALLEDPSAAHLAALEPATRAATERFVACQRGHGAQPVMLVRYEREAWVSEVDDYARVTFDERIRSQPHHALSFAAEGQGWRAVDNPLMQGAAASLSVLELKFTTAVPRWMVQLVQGCGLARGSFSKYGTSIRTWHCAPGPLARAPYGGLR